MRSTTFPVLDCARGRAGGFSACLRNGAAAGLLLLLAACRTLPPPPPPVVVEPPPRATPDFTISAGMLDTWNAIGQILVRERGVDYKGRAQMLGLYDLEYRGDRFLIVTRALPLTPENPVVATQVRAIRKDGQPDDSDAAAELLAVLREKLPDEVRLDASGARGKVRKGKIRN